MKYILYVLFVFSLSVACFAQNSPVISGRFVDSLANPLEAVTVYLMKKNDSTLVQYSSSDKNGFFVLKLSKQTPSSVLRGNMVGYIDFEKILSDELLQRDISLGDIVLMEYGLTMDELVITAETPPLRVKKDTLEYNAQSFKVRPDANLEELLKELPGVQIDEDKQITINGKAVSEILVNGKPFFNEDGAIALENLPAEIINKIQITDKKSKKERFTKELSKSEDASINITIDDDKNRGYFGRLTGGYGSDDRYEAALFVNAFTNKTKLSLIGSFNNINAVGFAMDDVFDNMSSNKSGSGITESRLLGANVVHEINSKLNVNGSYNYTASQTQNWTKRSSTRFLPSGEFSVDSDSKSEGDNVGHMANVSIDYISEKDALYIMPNFRYNTSSNQGSSFEQTFDENKQELNQSSTENNRSSDENAFNNTIRYVRKFEKDGQFLSAAFSNRNSKQQGHNYINSQTLFFQSTTDDVFRKQYQFDDNTVDAYEGELEFSQPITDSLTLKLGASFNHQDALNDLQVYDYDEQTGQYSELNVLQTNLFHTVESKVSPFIGFAIKKKVWSLNFTSTTEISNNQFSAVYNEKDYKLNKNYLLPIVNTLFRYSFSKNENLSIGYGYNQTTPGAQQLLDITDVSNPLNTIVGNPDLKLSGAHRINMAFRSYDFQSRTGYSFRASLNVSQNDIVNSVLYDQDKKSYSTYVNVSGAYQWSVSGEWNKSYKIDEHNFRFGFGMRYSNSLRKGFIDGQMYDAFSNILRPRVYLTYNYGELLTIKPSYNYNYSFNTYRNFSVDKANNFIHNFNIQTTSYWPKDFIWGNDLGYTFNSSMASGFKKDFYIWNMSLGYEFYQNRLRAKVKIYDILNQNSSSRRTIDPTQIVDTETLVLKQYVMFSLVYKLNEFKGASSKQSRPMRATRMGVTKM